MADQRLPQIKTAVLVKDLIAAIERTRDVELKANREEHREYKVLYARYVKEVRAKLRERLTQITSDFEIPQRRYGRGTSISDWLTKDLPEHPANPNSEDCVRSKYDGLIAQLKLSTEPKVRLSPEDFRKFMAGDSSACVC